MSIGVGVKSAVVPGGAGWCRVVPGGAGWCRGGAGRGMDHPQHLITIDHASAMYLRLFRLRA